MSIIVSIMLKECPTYSYLTTYSCLMIEWIVNHHDNPYCFYLIYHHLFWLLSSVIIFTITHVNDIIIFSPSFICQWCSTIPMMPSHHRLLWYSQLSFLFSAEIVREHSRPTGEGVEPPTCSRSWSQKKATALSVPLMVLMTHCPGQELLVNGFWSEVHSFFVLL